MWRIILESKFFRRNILLLLPLILLALPLVGCSDKKEIKNLQEYNYIIDETDLPSQKKGIEISEGEKITKQESHLCGNRVYATSKVYGQSYMLDEIYIQILNFAQLEWINHKNINNAFDKDGISYAGINPTIFPALDGTLYTSAYTNEGNTYIAKITESEIEQIVCDCTDEFEEEMFNQPEESFIIKGKDNNFYSYTISSGRINSYNLNLEKLDSYEINGKAAGLLQANKESDILW